MLGILWGFSEKTQLLHHTVRLSRCVSASQLTENDRAVQARNSNQVLFSYARLTEQEKNSHKQIQRNTTFLRSSPADITVL